MEEVNYVGAEIETELFRQHKTTLILVDFITHLGDMVSVDQKGYIFIWKYNR